MNITDVTDNGSTDPLVHTAHVKDALKQLISHLRSDVDRVEEPRAQALFETTAEVLQGLVTTYEHYDVGKEAAFRR